MMNELKRLKCLLHQESMEWATLSINNKDPRGATIGMTLSAVASALDKVIDELRAGVLPSNAGEKKQKEKHEN